jgi:hypothetical protein
MPAAARAATAAGAMGSMLKLLPRSRARARDVACHGRLHFVASALKRISAYRLR